MKQYNKETVTLEKIVGGGQTISTLSDGRKVFVWGGLPGETVEIQITKKRSKLAEAIVTQITNASSERIEPRDPESYLSTSPWQIMALEAEQRYKAALIEEAFELHNIVLPHPIDVYTNNQQYGYRNKVEFSWYGYEDEITGVEGLDLAFFRRGSHGKIIVDSMALLPEPIMGLAREIRDFLKGAQVTARQLKTLLIRMDQSGNCVWQLYIKQSTYDFISQHDAGKFTAQGGEVIYSDPKSPASRITKRLLKVGDTTLHDTVLDVPFRYPAESFFQINIPVYEQALRNMQRWIVEGPVIDMYSGVGTIGLTIGGPQTTLVEVDEPAVNEMRQNIKNLNSSAQAILAASEKSLLCITSDVTLIIDPPRAGLHNDIVNRILEVTPRRIIYLSCNPVTQARDTALLAEKYGIRHHQGYNFFPRTPHIEHLIVFDLKNK